MMDAEQLLHFYRSLSAIERARFDQANAGERPCVQARKVRLRRRCEAIHAIITTDHLPTASKSDWAEIRRRLAVAELDLSRRRRKQRPTPESDLVIAFYPITLSWLRRSYRRWALMHQSSKRAA